MESTFNNVSDIISGTNDCTSFTIYLSAIDSTQSENSENIQPGATSGAERLLVVEDEDALRMIVTEELERVGYSVLAAREGSEAIELFRSENDSIDCAILDIGLPDIPGVDVLQHIRSVTATVPVIIISGFINSVQREKFLRLGAQAVIQKPFNIENLLSEIRRQLNKMK